MMFAPPSQHRPGASDERIRDLAKIVTNAQEKKNNKWLAHARIVGAVGDGAIDGCYLSYSIHDNLDHAGVHASRHFYLESHGVILEGVLDGLLAAFSIMARVRDVANENDYQTYLKKIRDSRAWRIINRATYIFRAGLSGVKNGHHDFKDLLSCLQFLHVHMSFVALTAVGFGFGALLAVVLIYQYIRNQRRKETLAKVKKALKAGDINEGNRAQYLEMLNDVDYGRGAIALAAFDGLTDGIYLFGCIFLILGIFGVNMATAGLPAILTLTALAIWTLWSIVSKVSDEYAKQEELKAMAHALDSGKMVYKKQSFLWRGLRAFISAVKNLYASICEFMLLAAKKVTKLIVATIVTGLLYGFYLVYLRSIKPFMKYKKNETLIDVKKQSESPSLGVDLPTESDSEQEGSPDKANPLPSASPTSQRL